MMEADQKVVKATHKTVVCDGGKGTAGHPRIYLNIGVTGWVVCPYCSRRFELANGHIADASH
ncbi:MAG TPA: zinc-finger domain-containing protein [Alphaproteobacteria bacterium]|jgi:uncharacterized Zn-finger protein|nr:zinc-finger domain-containing protein [Alphaproteobacteria bacterium]